MGLFIGVMSGTSMDAVDTVLVDLSTSSPQLVASLRSPWDSALRNRMRSYAAGQPLDAAAYAGLDADVGEFFAAAIQALLSQTRPPLEQIQAIGCHGQTVAHAPDRTPPVTLQLGDANIITERTGITTITDFRRRDMAAGGQGAPLAPALHNALMRDEHESRVVLNLGGIANITVLPSQCEVPAIGFDTGPANCLMDHWATQHLSTPYDEDGAWADSATPNARLLTRMLADTYFSLTPPKSTGTQYFSSHWLNSALREFPGLAAAEVQATLLALTATTVADAIRRHAPDTERVLVCGGGVHNAALMRQLADLLERPVESTRHVGLDPDWMEATAFAWLAQQTLAGKTGNLPAVTGAAGPRILGAVHHA
ncbi:MAG: anhydro-N-acetylmuramic acid kinase [Gammaproteobacteria bacterium]|nr:anhydro-N-acetylmuramic acid kinase [Gammaproteobacteria bacterium]HOP15262.1 anhydro-N-acetylmuramic acid kinase [Gammaproteobacteria bacterium]